MHEVDFVGCVCRDGREVDDATCYGVGGGEGEFAAVEVGEGEVGAVGDGGCAVDLGEGLDVNAGLRETVSEGEYVMRWKWEVDGQKSDREDIGGRLGWQGGGRKKCEEGRAQMETYRNVARNEAGGWRVVG